MVSGIPCLERVGGHWLFLVVQVTGWWPYPLAAALAIMLGVTVLKCLDKSLNRVACRKMYIDTNKTMVGWGLRATQCSFQVSNGSLMNVKHSTVGLNVCSLYGEQHLWG